MKNFLKTFGLVNLGLIGVGVALLGYAFYIEPDRLILNEKEIEINSWDRAFEGFKIVAIGDIHGGSPFIDEEKIREIVRLSNAQSPDLVVLLGDFVSQKQEDKAIRERSLKMPMATIAKNLKGLKAKYGVVAVLGNHDNWYNDEIVARELSLVGFKVLQNQILTINNGGANLNLFGLIEHGRVFDEDTFRVELKEEVQKLKNDGDIVILEHNPDLVPVVTGHNSISKNIKLFLAGHTHGGQVWFPVFGSLVVPSKFGDKYAFGHIVENDIDIFVTSGVGTSVTPVRFMMPPEIAVLTIRSK